VSIGRTYAVAILGAGGTLVEIEADLASGLPALSLIGLPDRALGEAGDRVRSALMNAGLPLPPRKMTVNLSPAALPKQGSGFDLGIAVAALAATGVIPAGPLENCVHIGELALDGRVRPTAGVLPAVIAARQAGKEHVVVPWANIAEAELVPGTQVHGVKSIRDAAILHGAELDAVDVDPLELFEVSEPENTHLGDLADVVGNEDAIDALIIAAVGGHHMFMLGPPGAGKTMLASRLPGILPNLTTEAALEVATLQSLAGQPLSASLPTRPPFEAPHHSATAAALVGGGSGVIKPGAAARASHGVLFLDETPEFNSVVLDALRQPLESGTLTIARASGSAHFPAHFQLIMAANPCPCGQYGVRDGECTCTPMMRRRYLGKLSGPLMDRIDIQLRVERVTSVALACAEGSYRTSAQAQAQVIQARELSAARLRGTPWSTNAEVPGVFLRTGKLRLESRVTQALDRALERGHHTMRGYDRILKVAWSVADAEGCERPTAEHIARAVYLRKGI
jgi:magnesium chelatase family protein